MAEWQEESHKTCNFIQVPCVHSQIQSGLRDYKDVLSLQLQPGMTIPQPSHMQVQCSGILS